MHDLHQLGLLLVVSAPSGGGKTTVCDQILATTPNSVRAITCTTRQPRDGEKDGVDYFFLDAGDFLKRVQAGNFLEHATVYGNSYGTLKSEVLNKLRNGKDVLLSVDVQGAASIRDRAREDHELRHSLVTVFLAPPSIKALEERLKLRGKDAPAVIVKRLSVARHEIAQARHFDYIVVSQSREDDLQRMKAIITAEKLRHTRVNLPEYEPVSIA
ncbi:MAG: guanylate kinase [Verrucomicrobiales bacterium]